MKKVLAFAIAILCAATFVQAQEGDSTNLAKQSAGLGTLGLGARLAAGYGMLWGLEDDWSDSENDEKPGGIDLEAGIAGRYEITPLFHFTPELLFRYASYSLKNDSWEYEFNQMNIEIPLLVRANATPKFYAYIGPQLGFNLNNDVSLKDNVSHYDGRTVNYTMDEKIEQATFGFSVAAGAGYYIWGKLSVDFRVALGLSELYPDSGNIINLNGAKDIVFKLGVNYWVF